MEDLERKAIIKLSYNCNNNCFFCHAKPKKNFKDLSFSDVIKKIDKISQEVDCILFSGGEPTLRKDLFRVLKYLNKKEISWGIITNSRLLSLDYFFDKLAVYGLKKVYTTFHSAEREIHNKITNTDSFDQTVKGIRNTIERNIPLVVNIVLIKDNLEKLDKTINFLKKLGVYKIRLSFVETLFEEDLRNTPDIEFASKKVKKILNDAKDIEIGWDGFPLCLMKGFENKQNNLLTNNIKYISEVWEKSFYFSDKGNKIKLLKCNHCKRKEECEGIYAFYFKKRGFQIKPY